MAWHHVYPSGDLKEHVTDGYPEAVCWCWPEIDDDNSLVIHNSLDRREVYENEVH
jgi:hypothetical protein